MPEPPSALVDHVSITVNDLDAAVAFYDAVLGALGHHRVSLTASAAGYGRRNSGEDDRSTYLSVIRVSPAVVASERHWAFRAPNRTTVDEFHSAALAHGGHDDCGVGLRPEYHPTYYLVVRARPRRQSHRGGQPPDLRHPRRCWSHGGPERPTGRSPP